MREISNTNIVNTPAPSPQSTPLALLDKTNPRALVNLVPDKVAESILRVNPEWLQMNDAEFNEKVQPRADSEMRRLRVRIWEEYDDAQMKNRGMMISQMIRGVCSGERFYNKVLKDDKKVAYLFRPLQEYSASLKECLISGLNQLTEFLHDPPKNKDGKISDKTMEMILKAITYLDLRLNGAVVQRVEQKNLNVNVNQTVPEIPASVEDLRAELKKLRGETKAIDVTVDTD